MFIAWKCAGIQDQTGYSWEELRNQNSAAAGFGLGQDTTSSKASMACSATHSQSRTALQCYIEDEKWENNGSIAKCILLLLADITAPPMRHRDEFFLRATEQRCLFLSLHLNLIGRRRSLNELIWTPALPVEGSTTFWYSVQAHHHKCNVRYCGYCVLSVI